MDTSYVKFPDTIDNSPYDLVQPPDQMLYVGWTEPGEWFNLTVNVAEAGDYAMDLLYTSHQRGSFALDINRKPATGPIPITSTFITADPLALRQQHHWNRMKDAAKLQLSLGQVARAALDRSTVAHNVHSGGRMRSSDGSYLIS